MGTPRVQTPPPRPAADTVPSQGARSAAESTKEVAGTVKEQASNVTGEVSTQVRSLAGKASDEVRGQVDQQRSRVAHAIRRTGDEFAMLADKGEQSQLTTELTRRAAERAASLADYVERTRPAEVLDRVRSFARRRPGVFLLAATVTGAVAGRLIKGATTSAGGTDSTSTSTSPSTSSRSYEPIGTTYAEPLPAAPPAPVGGTPLAGSVPGGFVPGSTVPGSTVPGGAVPGGAVPGGAVPGGAVPGGIAPQAPREDFQR